MSAKLVVGAQWGDEGKAKVIDYLSGDIDIIVRYQGGANAGHTVKVGSETYIFHLVPSGILYPKAVCVIGNGVVFDPHAFKEEVDHLLERNIDVKGRVIVSDACHIVLPLHRMVDEAREASAGGHKIGTTKRGIGICYADKMMRIGLRTGDLLNEEKLKIRLSHILEQKNPELELLYKLKPVSFDSVFSELKEFGEWLKPLLQNTGYYLNKEAKAGKTILLEGAQGTALDIDFGTYPFVTSSNTTTGGALAGSGISYQYLKEVIGITKAYVSRVGEGPFPTELMGDEGDKLRKLGHEFGATTGRPRRCGWFDVELVKHAARVNGLTGLALTKIDVLSEYGEIPVAVGYEFKGKRLDYFPSYGLEDVRPIYETLPGWKSDISHVRKIEDLPTNCRNYLDKLEALCGVPIKIVSLGAERESTIAIH